MDLVEQLRQLASEPWKHDGGVWPDLMREAAGEIEWLRQHNPMTAIGEIAAERKRQIEVEGWNVEHDSQHVAGELAAAAACYALSSFLDTDHSRNTIFTRYWPWDRKWWKPRGGRADLVRAGALIVAQIERMDWEATQQRELLG